MDPRMLVKLLSLSHALCSSLRDSKPVLYGWATSPALYWWILGSALSLRYSPSFLFTCLLLDKASPLSRSWPWNGHPSAHRLTPPGPTLTNFQLRCDVYANQQWRHHHFQVGPSTSENIRNHCGSLQDLVMSRRMAGTASILLWVGTPWCSQSLRVSQEGSHGLQHTRTPPLLMEWAGSAFTKPSYRAGI